MEVNIKLGELRQIMMSLSKLAAKELPVKASYRISKLNKQLKKEHEDFDGQRIKLLHKYCEKDGEQLVSDGEGKAVFKDEPSFWREFTELCEIEVTKEIFPLSIEDFGDATIAGVDLMVLDRFIAEQE